MTAPAFVVFVPGPIRNPMNGARGHWSKHARWARDWRERTGQYVLGAVLYSRPTRLHIEPAVPKTVTLTAHVVRGFDDDNLPACLKPCRDALIDLHVIHSDAPDSGHRFVYRQVIDPDRRGVEIAVALQ